MIVSYSNKSTSTSHALFFFLWGGILLLELNIPWVKQVEDLGIWSCQMDGLASAFRGLEPLRQSMIRSNTLLIIHY